MSYPPSAYKTWTAGEILTASDLNNTVTTINNSNIPEDIDDFSVNTAEMQTTVDPYPAGSPSLATALDGEIARLRYQLLNALQARQAGVTNWYEDFKKASGVKGADVASAASLTLGADGNFFDITGTTAITSIGTLGVGSVVYLQFDSSLVLTHHNTDLVLPNATNIRTRTGDVAVFLEYATGDWFLISYSKGRSSDLINYRRPVLRFVAVNAVDVEANTGTANETKIVFPDGDARTVQEDTSASNLYRRFIITAAAEFTSGTEDSGLRSGLSEANNTWYAIYAVKSLINSAKFVLVGDTAFPVTADFSTLNSRYGTNGWVYLGMIRNGDSSSATGDILSFVQTGNKTVFTNKCAAIGGNAGNGIEFATNTATTMSYTYAAGDGDHQIPNHILTVDWYITASSTGAVWGVTPQTDTTWFFSRQTNTPGTPSIRIVDVGASLGIAAVSTSSTDHQVNLCGFTDGALMGSNPVI